MIESGIGGLHDATNVVSRSDKVAAVTAIGLDHTEILGATVTEIAHQKAGILPRGGRAFAVLNGPPIDEVVRSTARSRQCRLHFVGDASPSSNSALALEIAEYLARRDEWPYDAELATSASEATKLPGRMELCHWRGRVLLLDGAHNPLKLGAVADSLNGFPDPPVWVLGFKTGKNWSESLDRVARSASAVIATEFATDGRRALGGPPVEAARIAIAALRCGVPTVSSAANISEALNIALAVASPQSAIVVTGSFRLVADAARACADQTRCSGPEGM